MERWIPYFQDLIECCKLLDKHSSIEGSEQPASAVSTSAPPQPLGCCLGNFCHPQRTTRTSHSQGSGRPIDILEQHFSFKSCFVLQKFLTLPPSCVVSLKATASWPARHIGSSGGSCAAPESHPPNPGNLPFCLGGVLGVPFAQAVQLDMSRAISG